MTNLLNCPFCDSNNLEILSDSMSEYYKIHSTFVCCNSCRSKAPDNIWNTRASGWVSVKTKLPEPVEFIDDCQISKEVLVSDNEIEIATYCVKHKDWQAEGMTLYNVSHWQELPDKPKETK